MKIRIYKWDELDLFKIATLTYTVKQAEMRSTGDQAIEAIVNWLQDKFAQLPRTAVLAHSGEQSIGWLMLVTQDPIKVEINPWFLGGHPLVAPDSDCRVVGSQLLKAAINWSREEGFETIELCTARDELYETYSTWYGSLGFHIREESVGMTCDLSEPEVADAFASVTIPAGFEIQGVREVNQDDLYQCYYDAFQAGQSRFFFDQTEKEKRAYFDTFGVTYGMNEQASLALTKGTRVVGFSFVLPVSGGHCFLDWMGIHPDFRRIGMGTVLLRLIMKTAAGQGARTMGLNCDAGNTRAIALYKKNGWREAESEIKYVLDLQQTNS